MANALTALRLLLVVPFALLMAQGGARRAGLTALILAAAIATDLLDGPVARRLATVTAAGGAFDHTVDCLFVTCGLAAGAARGAFPWILPVLVVAAFVQYVGDSYWLHHRRALRMSRLGRYNGMLYFAPLGADVLIRLGLYGLEPFLTLLVWALVASTVVSMGSRLWALRNLPRKGGASRAGETGDPSRR